MSLSKLKVWLTLTFLGLVTARVNAHDETLEKLKRDFDRRIVPLLVAHCLDCHGSEVQEAQLDLSVFRDLKQVNKSHPTWQLVLERLDSKEMPPEEVDHTMAPWQNCNSDGMRCLGKTRPIRLFWHRRVKAAPRWRTM